MTLMTIAMVLLWAAVITLAVTVFALIRQIGLLHERVAPVGALSIEKQSLKTGEAAPEFELQALSGASVSIGGLRDDGRSTLLFFLSETCPVCKTLLPILKKMRVEEAQWLRIVLASDGEWGEHSAFIREAGLQDFDYLLSAELGRGYEIGKLPYGVLINEAGTLLTHGLVNNREHLESFIEARQLGVATVQEFAGRNAA
jgi:methylamine dehydrogenase accessory protein MauD